MNLEKAREMVREIEELTQVKGNLKAAFAKDELGGGWVQAVSHPLWIQADERIAELREQLTLLI